MDEQLLDEWEFRFGLCVEGDGKIASSKCDELLDLIIDWAEANGYGIGGGFGPFSESES